MANPQPYKKEIFFEQVTEPTLVRVKIDNELYAHTTNNFRDVRLHSNQGVEGYFIKSDVLKNIENQKRLTAENYDREKAKLTYIFKEPFDVESITLNIEDRNFESLVDIYVDGELLSAGHKIFDYSQETGNQEFTIKISKIRAKEVAIVYHLDKTTAFYKKYQNLQKATQYLTIKSVLFSNENSIKEVWDKTEIGLLHVETKEKKTSYIFKTNNIPFVKIQPNIEENSFNRDGKVYISDDSINWHYLNSFSLYLSTLSSKKNETILSRTRSKYLKLVVENRDNKPLNMESLSLYSTAKYLYFIAHTKKRYELYFGNKHLSKPLYEIEDLVSSETVSILATLSDKFFLESKVDEVSFFEENRKILFMILILLAVGLMIYIAFGLLQRTSE